MYDNEHMATVSIRSLKQNASRVVADAAAGETITITDRGRPVAQISPIVTSPLQRLLELGRARPSRTSLQDLPPPPPGPDVSATLARMRDSERY